MRSFRQANGTPCRSKPARGARGQVHRPGTKPGQEQSRETGSAKGPGGDEGIKQAMAVRRELDPPIGAVCRNGARSVNGDQEVSASNGKRRRSVACRQPPGCARRRRKRNRAPEKASVRVRRVMKGNPLERIVSRALMSIEDRNRVLAQCLGRPIRNTREGTKSARSSCLLVFWGQALTSHALRARAPPLPLRGREVLRCA